ncbi:MAG: penicillin-binding protein 1C [Leptospiraceae bacterium]|nr:penicillin-binding protein 1C [Leptospiraceae bacterium]
MKDTFTQTLMIIPILLNFICFPLLGEKYKFKDIKKEFISSESYLLDKNGKILQSLRTNLKERKINWTPLEKVSNTFLEAVIQTEDKRFYDHSGVDWIALGAGVWGKIKNDPTRGASTITMQLASILNDSLKSKGKKNISQKWDQIQEAKELEENLTKEEILEAYINLVSYRGDLIGIDAASQAIFKKKPHGLDELESILLASMIKNPSFSESRIIKRSCYLYKRKYPDKPCDEIKSLALNVLGSGVYIPPEENLAPHLAHKIFDKESKTVKTTLDLKIQKFTIEAIQNRLAGLKEKNVKDAAILVVENKKGNVLAYVGSSGDFSKSEEIDGITSKRQAGSTLKPFSYGLAFEKKIITPSTLLNDEPVQIQVGNGIYSPSNYQGKFHGIVTARTALASSLNVPAVKVLDLTGVENFIKILEELGFQNLRDGEYYGLSIALGSLDITLWDLVNAYRTFANGGVYSDMGYFSDEKRESKRVYSKEVAFLISNILSDRVARSPTFGLENSLATKYPSSVKTGTSKDMRDNWCIGYTDKYTIGVWVGNYSGEPMWNVSGITGAAPIYADIVNFLHTGDTFTPSKIPEGIVKIKIKDDTGSEYDEYFIKGTESNFTNITGLHSSNKIKYPVKNTIIAIDPDIPFASQRVFFEALEQRKDDIWYLNGKRIGNAGSLMEWNPIPGKHKLELRSKTGQLKDKVKFEVR